MLEPIDQAEAGKVFSLCAQVDTLEIQLREAADIVEHYVLVEATRTHKGEEKPLMWERIRSWIN